MASAACGRLDFDDRSRDPVLHLPFDETADLYGDHSGRDHVTTCSPCPAATSTARVGTGAALFDGTACIRVNDAPDLHATAFSYTVWFRATQVQNATVYSRPETSEVNELNVFEVYVRTIPNYTVLVHRTQFARSFAFGAWMHVAATFDGVTFRAYTDGVATDAIDIPAPAALIENQVLIGCDRDGGADIGHFTGEIDDVRFYDVALTDAEVVALAE